MTSLARTVIDLARTLPFRSGVIVADSALHGLETGQPYLVNVIKDCSRWPGIEKARRVVEFSDPLAESPFESIARVAFRDGGLPRPMLQVYIAESNRVIARVDFLWDEHATIAEADGAMKYADPERARQQLKRDADLRRAGYEVIHFTWHELVSAPEQVVQSIRVAFSRAARLRGQTRPTGRSGRVSWPNAAGVSAGRTQRADQRQPTAVGGPAGRPLSADQRE